MCKQQLALRELWKVLECKHGRNGEKSPGNTERKKKPTTPSTSTASRKRGEHENIKRSEMQHTLQQCDRKYAGRNSNVTNDERTFSTLLLWTWACFCIPFKIILYIHDSSNSAAEFASKKHVLLLKLSLEMFVAKWKLMHTECYSYNYSIYMAGISGMLWIVIAAAAAVAGIGDMYMACWHLPIISTRNACREHLGGAMDRV